MNINLGYIHLDGYTSKSPLFPSWMVKESKESTAEGRNYAKEIEHSKPNEVIIPEGIYSLVIDYPLNKPFQRTIKVKRGGMTRRKFVNLVARLYKLIYRQEDRDTKVPTGNIPGLWNRSTSNGRYGIWGHHIDDLILHTLVRTKNSLRVIVDS
jgi:hypothetical protein